MFTMGEHKSVISDRPRDCFACKLVGGFGLIGLGLYVVRQGFPLRRGNQRTFIFTCGLGNYLSYQNCNTKDSSLIAYATYQ